MPGGVPIDLAQRIEQSRAVRAFAYAEAMARLHPDWPVATRAIAGGVLTYIHPSSPVNGARGLGLSGPLSEVDLLEVESFFRQRHSAVRFDICPLLDQSLVARLGTRGYHRLDSLAVLYRTLGAPQSLPAPQNDILVTRASPDQAALWLSTTACGFDSSDEPDDLTLDVLAGNFYSANGIPYLAWMQGRAVGGGALFTADRAAELGSDSTLRQFRRHGVHTALIAARLGDACGMGIDLAVMCAEPGSQSQRNAERLGFQVAYLTERLVRDS